MEDDEKADLDIQFLLDPLFDTYKIQDDIAAVYEGDILIEDFKEKYSQAQKGHYSLW